MNYKLRTKNSELRTQQAFTLIELVVAVAILAMVMSFVGIIFKFGIGSYRAAVANAQIMRKLRAVTNQLNSDFKGLRRDAPLLIWFEQYPDPCYPNDPTKYQRFDQIMFFAAGDFQSTQLYDDINADGWTEPAFSGLPVRGNLARIHYAQAQVFDPGTNLWSNPCDIHDPEDRILARRRHILTADTTVLPWPDVNDLVESFNLEQGYNERYEHDRLSLARWKTFDPRIYQNIVIPACLHSRPAIDMDEPATFHKLICQGLATFAIQWAYWDWEDNPVIAEELRWYPSNDPNGDGRAPPHFELLTNPKNGQPAPNNRFGIFLNLLDTPSTFYEDEEKNIAWFWYRPEDTRFNPNVDGHFLPGFYPTALKFTFALYDERGILENGRKFTHIVYLSD